MVVAGDSRAVVDLGTEGVQRHATLAVPLTTAHLGTAETTGALDTDALSAGLAGGLDSLAHSATEGNAALELLGDRLSNEVGVELGALDLDNVDGELALGDASDLLELGAEGIDLGTFLPMTTPGRAVRMMTFTLSPARSISTRETAARERRFSRYLRISRSLPTVLAR